MAADVAVKTTAVSRVLSADSSAFSKLNAASQQTPQVGGFRAVSFDDDTGKFLYNGDVQQIVAKAAAHLKRKLDIVGFDACLMSMIETAYGFRDTASFMVSSEELEPGPGWDYSAIVKPLTSRPTMTPLDLSNAVVAA